MGKARIREINENGQQGQSFITNISCNENAAL